MIYKSFFTQVIKYQEEGKVGFFKPRTQMVDKKRCETVDETFRRIMDYIVENNIKNFQIIPIPLTFKTENKIYGDSIIHGTSEIQQMQFNLIYDL